MWNKNKAENSEIWNDMKLSHLSFAYLNSKPVKPGNYFSPSSFISYMFCNLFKE